MKRRASRPDVDAVLNGLKDFQRSTVDYVFRRLYLDPDATRRFLIADEVGLGKTLVARGVIARAIDYLWDNVERIDIVYICSNADIARQNINRLRVTAQEDFVLASRITLLPTKISDLKKNPLNFISFTPGTSFDLKSNLGTAEERALVYWLLNQAWGIPGTAPLNVLQGGMGTERFRNLVKQHSPNKKKIDESLAEEFRRALKRRRDLRSRFEDLCERFGYARKHIPDDDVRDRAIIVGELRTLLAATCLRALEPDLIILDEFQRFKHLLDGQDEASRLARELFNYSDEKMSVRVILLSATPYKMYTLNDEATDDDHYKDFCQTLRFLQTDERETVRFEGLLAEYRRELFRLGNGVSTRLFDIKQELQARLRRVMVRTERLAVSEDRDGMLVNVPSDATRLEPQDLQAYVAIENIARLLDHDSVMEYWKSAPYLLNFMDDYKFKHAFQDAIAVDSELNSELAQTIAAGNNLLLSWHDISRYEELDPGNARLRGLMAEMFGLGAWRLLWIPPSLPYYQPGGPFASPSLAQFTKRLVFSSWRVVPKVIAALLSYEAERQMNRLFDRKAVNSPEDRDRQGRLLRFDRRGRRLTGMPVLGLVYPGITLAQECDPLVFLASRDQERGVPTIDELLDHVRDQIEQLLNEIRPKSVKSGPEDEAWYWAAPILLDRLAYGQQTYEWFDRPDLAAIWSGKDSTQDEEYETHWSAHVDQARELATGKISLGRCPEDLSSVLAQMAIAGPGIAALRALSRVAGGSRVLSINGVRDRAAQMARSFVYVFNLPEVTALLRGMNREEPYWRRVLEYCVNGGLQPTLDEYVHVLRESLGLLNRSTEETASEVSKAMCQALTLHTSRFKVDKIDVNKSPRKAVLKKSEVWMRGRFALRFGEEESDDSSEMTRADQVRAAFNSPFWPFVLATTSVGQEGLDFHLYCHAVVHWNLPSNPVDLEQREGRVHRYKGHAVRKNLALEHGASALTHGHDDPWEVLFHLGKVPGASHLMPFWVYPGKAKIERYVPALPLSREVEQMIALRRSLAVYRMVFGQNRQEDLLSYLLTYLPESEIPRVVQDLRIDLSPPVATTAFDTG